jgi:hypothetical protein
MEQGTFDFSETASPAPVKLCECGCGQPAPIAKRTQRNAGHVKGRPIRFILGHSLKGARPREWARTLTVEAGQRIGNAVVMDPDVILDGPGRTRRDHAARLRCDCGTEYVRRIADILRRADGQSCSKRIEHADLIGRRFSKLTSIRMVGTKRYGGHPQAQWLCKCECGNELIVLRCRLITGDITSCGCGKFGPKRGYGFGEAALGELMNAYRRGAKDRGLAWDLTRSDFERLTSLDCHYCGAAPAAVLRVSPTSGSYVFNGLDRVDNTLGYAAGNVVPCCKICNFAKRDMPYGDFLAWIGRLASFHFFRPEVMPARLLAPTA